MLSFLLTIRPYRQSLFQAEEYAEEACCLRGSPQGAIVRFSSPHPRR